MNRRRTLVASGIAVVLVIAGVVALAVFGGGDTRAERPSPVALAYARTWDATCVALRTDATRTAAGVRARLAGGASAAERRRVARRLVAPYLGRTQRRLRRIVAAVPPPQWRTYHDGARRRLRAAADRTGAARTRVRAGDLGAPSALRLGDLARSADAPEGLRRLTPGCTAPDGA